jgi:hypothetical protein
MPIVQITRPEGITEEMYDAVNERMGGDMPAGMIVHTSGRDENGVFQIVDVWESRDAMQHFEDDRLRPAIADVMRAHGQDPDAMPQANQTAYETYKCMGAGAAVPH